ncbi:MAG: hypothetical protein IH600_05610 [Bacteroidetes bacterium]|nr:hypothetical protein [Bacteroidota bacterium]
MAGTKRVAIVLVDFIDSDSTWTGAKGSWGRMPDSTLKENKYRYRDYYDIMFQENGNVIHPDTAVSSVFSDNQTGWYQYGSFHRYIHDNSFGLCEVEPYIDGGSGREGILNAVTLDSTGEDRNASINWLRLPLYKPRTGGEGWYTEIVEHAFTIADSAYNPDWKEIDALLIVYAGGMIGGGAAGYKAIGDTVTAWSVVAERNWNDCFMSPAIPFHELVHSVCRDYRSNDLYNRDLYASGTAQGKTGHYSLMGSSIKTAYVPPMLDPWHRLRFGWLDFKIHDQPGDWNGPWMPIVELPYGNGPPWVMIIPVSEAPLDTILWDYQWHSYLIIENRRLVGWDDSLRVLDIENSSTCCPVDPSCEGGFLVWGAGTIRNANLNLYEADGNYDLIDSTKLEYGGPGDFFDGSEGKSTFSVRTKPGLIDWVLDPNPGCESGKTRNVFLFFREYNANADSNQLGRLIIDQLFVQTQVYGTTARADSSATKYNGQQKHTRFDDQDYFVQNLDGMVLVNRSTDHGASWRDVYVVSPIEGMGTARDDHDQGYAENATIAATNEGIWCFWEFTGSDYSYIARKPVGAFPENCTDHYATLLIDPPSDNPLRPASASDGNLLVCAFPGPDSMYYWISRDGGLSFARETMRNRAGSFSNPSVGVDDTTFVIAYALGNRVEWYDSDSQWRTTLSLSDTLNILSMHDPHCTFLDRRVVVDLSMSYTVTGNPDPPDLFAVASFSRDLDSSYGSFATDVFVDRDNHLLRDARVIIPDTMNSNRRVHAWIVEHGDALMTAGTLWTDKPYVKPSSLSEGSMTSYPILAEHTQSDPLIASTRVVSLYDARPRDALCVTFRSRTVDSSSGTRTCGVDTELMLGVRQDGTHMQLFRQHTGELRDSLGTLIGEIPPRHMDWYEGGMNGTPIDSLTRTTPVEMYRGDYITLPMRLVTTQGVDTTILEAILYDAMGGAVLSTSGEYRVPPGLTDTSFTAGIELPAGQSHVRAYMRTNIRRGSFESQGRELKLDYLHTYFDIPTPKRPAVAMRLRATEVLEVYPTQLGSGQVLNVIIAKGDAGRLTLFDILGRQVCELHVPSDALSSKRTFSLPSLTPGMYILVFQSVGERCIAKIIVL